MHFAGLSHFHFIAFCRVGLNYNRGRDKWERWGGGVGGAVSGADVVVKLH